MTAGAITARPQPFPVAHTAHYGLRTVYAENRSHPWLTCLCQGVVDHRDHRAVQGVLRDELAGEAP